MQAAAEAVRETRAPLDVPLWTHPGWAERFPWLVQGTTGAGDGAEPFDLGLFGDAPVGAAIGRWRALGAALRMPTMAHARQVHGASLAEYADAPPPGLLIGEGVDGHLTALPGVLLAVSVADCVPVSVVDGRRRAVAMLHAGWRGVAGGILEAAIARMRAAGSDPADLRVHCGPAICGRCYEVGPEVHARVRPDRAAPAAACPIDLRAALVERATALGVPGAQLSVSELCTRCGGAGAPADAFFSHRGGARGRQMGVLGIRG